MSLFLPLTIINVINSRPYLEAKMLICYFFDLDFTLTLSSPKKQLLRFTLGQNECRLDIMATKRSYEDGLELLIQLTHSLPVRALSPALYVGNTPIADYELAGPNLYRFFVIDPGSLEPGAAISLGWPQLPDMKRNLSNFRFQIRGNGNGLA
jgi:hypothetical protein